MRASSPERYSAWSRPLSFHASRSAFFISGAGTTPLPSENRSNQLLKSVRSGGICLKGMLVSTNPSMDCEDWIYPNFNQGFSLFRQSSIFLCDLPFYLFTRRPLVSFCESLEVLHFSRCGGGIRWPACVQGISPLPLCDRKPPPQNCWLWRPGPSSSPEQAWRRFRSLGTC